MINNKTELALTANTSKTFRYLMAIIIVLASSCEIKQQQDKDSETLENFLISDIYGTSYELESMLNEYNYLLFFGFATWCHWSQSSIPQINTIDSITKYLE